jgi:2-dehydro-3-deoxyphosphogluconate aldolase/(4S)-4-hydroxy-2-oxoglutarate aldolase
MKIKNPQKGLEASLLKAPVVPVMVIENLKDAVPLARALVKGGLPVLEITLRTEAALDCIKAIVGEVEGAIVGSGTVLTAKQLRQSQKAGCVFAVSPGATGKLLGAAEDEDIALLPGAATASEAMALLEWGYALQKFFPAEAAGGAAYLSSLASPLPQIKFCPTGGITPELAPKYLKLSNVITLGGSWMAPKAMVQEGKWDAIEKLARSAAALAQNSP